jgi:predicted O-methyltransferase YrrM
MMPPEPAPGAVAVRAVIERLLRERTIVAQSDGTTHQIFPTAVRAEDASALRRLVAREAPRQSIEIGLAYGISALHICDGLLQSAPADARHTVIDPFQHSRFAGCGLQVLREAGLASMVEHHAEPSHFALPQLLHSGRQFDLAFVDGNHRFDAVFVDLYYLARLVRRGGLIILDDYGMPAIRRAVAFFTANLGWALEQTSDHLAALRTSDAADERHFTYYVEF